MNLFFGFVLVTVSILTIVYAYFKYKFNYWKSRGVPCDEPSIPFGNAKGVGKTIHVGDFTSKLYNKFKASGAKFFGVYFSTIPMAVILDLDLVKNILVKDFTHFNDRGEYMLDTETNKQKNKSFQFPLQAFIIMKGTIHSRHIYLR